jgi:large subunit ribosomal protein L22
MAAGQVKRKKLMGKTTMLAEATLRQVRISPRKLRLSLELIKGRQVAAALDILQFSPKKSARITEKLLRSAIANAAEKGANVDKLWVVGGKVDMGRSLKRFIPQAKGQAHPIIKRSAHMVVQLAEVK